MRCLRYNVASTLDGFIASFDGTTDWIVDDPAIDFTTLYASFSTFVMGRKTWETLLAYGDQNPLREKPRDAIVVFSRTMSPEQHRDITVISGDIVEYMEALKKCDEDGTKDIWLYGGGQVASCLLDARLVDTVEVAIMPVLIGDGIRLVEKGTKNHWKLQLQSVEKLEKSGILMSKYRVLY